MQCVPSAFPRRPRAGVVCSRVLRVYACAPRRVLGGTSSPCAMGLQAKVRTARQAATAAMRPLKEDPLREMKMSWFTNRDGHRNVLRMLGVVHDSAMVASIFPFVNGGDCMDYMEAQRLYDEGAVKLLFRDMMRGACGGVPRHAKLITVSGLWPRRPCIHALHQGPLPP